MNKKTAIRVYIALMTITFLVVAVIIIVTKLSIARDSAKNDAESEYDYETNLTLNSELVDTVTGTTPEMLDYKYWAEKVPEQVLFTPQEIEDINENNLSYVKYKVQKTSWRNKLFMYDLPDTIDGAIIKALIKAMYEADYVEKTPEVYIDGKEIPSGYIDGLIENTAIENVPENVEPKYAINLKRTVSKIFPTQDFATETPDDIYFDSFISAEVMPYEGVVVLHESKDGEYSYILIGSYLGWVKSDNLAICDSKEQWLSFAKPDEFLVVTGSEIVFDETATESQSSGLILPMGTRIKLSEDHETLVNGRRTYGCFVVDIPTRGDDGKLTSEKALLPVSKDINVGYLPMTSTKVLEQAFKFLGRIYGYGGSFGSNDCSGFVRQVYACFGMELPRNASAIANMSDLGSNDITKLSVEGKKKLLSQTPPGMPLFMTGHLMMYIGMENGEPYVISSCATFIEPGDKNGDIVDAYCVFVSDMNLLRKSGITWLESISHILNKEY